MTVKREGSVLPKLHPEPVPDVNTMNNRNEEQMKLINQHGGEITVPQFGKQAGSSNNKIVQNAKTLSEIDAQADLDNDLNHIDNTSGGGRKKSSKKKLSRRRKRVQKKPTVSMRKASRHKASRRKASRRKASRRHRRNKRGGSVKWGCMR